MRKYLGESVPGLKVKAQKQHSNLGVTGPPVAVAGKPHHPNQPKGGGTLGAVVGSLLNGEYGYTRLLS